MKFLISILFVLSIITLNAQTEQTEAVAEASVRPKCTQIVTGEVRNKTTNELLPQAEVVLSDTNGNIIETQAVTKDATFSFAINCKTDYILEGRRADFTAESKQFTTTGEAGKRLKLLILLDKGNIDFITGAKGKEVEQISTKKIQTKEIQFEETKLKEIKSIEKKPASEKEEVTIHPVYFDLASSYLNKAGKAQLQKIVNLMKKYPNMVVELSAHSDAQGSDKINNWFADRRAKRVYDYLLKKGIRANRIINKGGFGATRLVNNCNKDVQCTEAQHQQNRRTEFVIVSM